MTQLPLWTLTGGWTAIALFAIWRDRRRQNRANLDRVGWVPWAFVLIIAIFGAAISAALALKAG